MSPESIESSFMDHSRTLAVTPTLTVDLTLRPLRSHHQSQAAVTNPSNRRLEVSVWYHGDIQVSRKDRETQDSTKLTLPLLLTAQPAAPASEAVSTAPHTYLTTSSHSHLSLHLFTSANTYRRLSTLTSERDGSLHSPTSDAGTSSRRLANTQLGSLAA